MVDERDRMTESVRRGIRREPAKTGEKLEREREGSRYREEKETKGIETGDKPLIVEARCSEKRG